MKNLIILFGCLIFTIAMISPLQVNAVTETSDQPATASAASGLQEEDPPTMDEDAETPKKKPKAVKKNKKAKKNKKPAKKGKKNKK